MEFKFRAVDDRSRTIFSPSAGVANFSDRPITGGYWRSPDFRGNAEAFDIYRESVRRELEKARIREEIIAMEIVRRRVMEADLRRDLMMMERDMVLRRAAESGPPFEDRLTMRFDRRYSPHPIDASFPEDDPWAFPGQSSFHMPPMPLQQRFPEAIAYEPKPEANKDKIIFLPRPQPQPLLSGTKRKAATPPTVLKEPKTKPKEEWSCALCQVSATSNKGLNQHLKGKKHKAREARLQAQNAAKDSNHNQPPKKTSKTKRAGATESKSLKPGAKTGTVSTPVETDGKDLVQKIKDPEENKDDEMPLQKSQKADHMNEKDGMARKHSGEATTDIIRNQRKFKSWCETCKVGVHSEKVMKAHRKGKRHMARLKELGLNEAAPAITTAPETTEEEDSNVAAKANEKQADNVTADAAAQKRIRSKRRKCTRAVSDVI